MIKFTAIVVVYNEDIHLDECLEALSFCDEKIIVDLGSTDKSIEIALKNNFRIIHHDRVEIVEEIRGWAIEQAKNDWVVFVDPDEIFPKNSLSIILNLIKKEYSYKISLSKIKDFFLYFFEKDYKWVKMIGGFSFPFQNYFIDKPVKHGRWKNNAGVLRVFNKKSVITSGFVHRGLGRKREFENIKIKKYIKHYWVNSMDHFYEKHNRYLKYEGESRYSAGLRFSKFCMYKSLVFVFVKNYIYKLGFLDGKNGLVLIKLAMWYEKEAWLSLKLYQQNNLNKKNV